MADFGKLDIFISSPRGESFVISSLFISHALVSFLLFLFIPNTLGPSMNPFSLHPSLVP